MQCLPGYSGDSCTIDPNVCLDECQNGGLCENGSCNCLKEYIGDFCEEESACHPSQTQCNLEGGNLCELDDKLEAICKVRQNDVTKVQTCKSIQCEPGYVEPFCNEPESTPCDNQPCKNGGTCKIDGNSFECQVCSFLSAIFIVQCLDAYTGETCEDTPCDPNPCQNNGTCTVKGNLYECKVILAEIQAIN